MTQQRQIQVDWSGLDLAFHVASDDERVSFGFDYFLDLKTGRTVQVTEEHSYILEKIQEELPARVFEDGDALEQAIRETEIFQQLTNWEQQDAIAVAMLEFGDPSRFERIPPIGSRQSYGFMEDFIETVSDPAMRDRLTDAIQGRGAFSRFRATIGKDRRWDRAWRDYQIRREREVIHDWLASIGVEPTNPEQDDVALPPLPDLRKIMFAEVRRFVRFARHDPGVTRIALIGSLTTVKEFPHDIDLLVTIQDDCDLSKLARLGRELAGHMLGHQAGADIFLADPDGNYLGRTCPWKKCGPGIRRSCDALHCGARKYLHDDWNTIRLDRDLIANPPVILWPQPAAGRKVAADISAELIQPLKRHGG